jgi:hypothetical protein
MRPYVPLHPHLDIMRIEMEPIAVPIYYPPWMIELAVALLSGGK